MNVLLEAYLERNFGDDLFVTLLINRYRNHRFYLLDDRKKGYALVGDSKFGNVCLITEEEAFSDKLSLLFRRSKQQIFIERQRKDFLKWMLEKVTKKDFHTRKLREFDYLEHVKRILELGQSELEEIGLDDDWRYEPKNTQRVFIFASVPFYDVGGGQRSSQLARTFNSLGKQVYYIHAYPCAEENVPDMAMPVSAHKYVEEIQVDWFKRRV